MTHTIRQWALRSTDMLIVLKNHRTDYPIRLEDVIDLLIDGVPDIVHNNGTLSDDGGGRKPLSSLSVKKYRDRYGVK